MLLKLKLSLNNIFISINVYAYKEHTESLSWSNICLEFNSRNERNRNIKKMLTAIENQLKSLEICWQSHRHNLYSIFWHYLNFPVIYFYVIVNYGHKRVIFWRNRILVHAYAVVDHCLRVVHLTVIK